MATPIRIKRSAVPGKRPTLADLQLGEPAINTYDGRIYLKRDTGVASTVSLVTPWTENVGGSIYYNDGFIGAGTTTPTSRLDIVGDGKFTGVVTATTFSGQINAGVTTVSSLSIGSTQVISSGRELQNILSLDSITTATIEAAIVNAPNNFNDLKIAGIATFTNGPVFIGTGTSTGTASQTLQVTGGAYVSDSIGIGITNPESTGLAGLKLAISGGDVNIDSTRVIYWGGNVAPSYIRGTSGTSTGKLTFSAGNVTFIDFSANVVGANVGDFSPDSSYVIDLGRSSARYRNLWLSGTQVIGSGTSTGTQNQKLQIYGGAYLSENLGIGITNPTSKLHVIGDALVSGILTVTNGIQGIGIQSAGFNIAVGVITALNFVGAGNSFSYNAGTKTVDINIGGSQWTFVEPGNPTTSSIYRVNGNIGIGTTNPISKLDLVGDGKFTGVITATTFNGQLNSAIGTVTTLNATNANITTANIVTGVVTTLSGTNLNYSGVGTITQLVSTAASFSQLQVTGISTFTNGPVFVGSGTTTGTAAQRLQVTGGAYVSGSVGVGTTNPRETLDVVGTIGVQASGAANRFEIQHNVALSSLDFIFI